MLPVAVALKVLEANAYTFGLYLPTLFNLRRKLVALKKTCTRLCRPLVLALEKGLETRFGKVMDLDDKDGRSVPLFLAMVTNPRFKINYMGPDNISDDTIPKIRSLLFKAGTK